MKTSYIEENQTFLAENNNDGPTSSYDARRLVEIT